VLLRKRGESEQVRRRLLEQCRRVGEALLELVDDAAVLLEDCGRVGLGEDRPDHRRHERLGALRHPGQQVAHEVRPAALPGRAGQRRRDRVDEAGVRVRADQADTAEAAGDERAQEGEPGRAVLARDDVEAERLAQAVAVDADRVHDADVDRAAALAALHDERVEGDVRVRGAVERPAAEVLDDLIEALRQPRDLALRHPLDAELGYHLLDTASRDAGQIGVGDHRHERLLGPPARLQQPVREVAALAQLRDRELDRADARVPVALAIAIAAVDPLGAALAIGRTAERVDLSAHQRLGKLLHHRPQQIRARLLELLAQPAGNVHRRLDHRAPPRFVDSTPTREDDALVSYHRTRGRRSALAYGSRSTTAAEDHLNRVVHHERGRYSRASSLLRQSY
jgi:hypothetical protein